MALSFFSVSESMYIVSCPIFTPFYIHIYVNIVKHISDMFRPMHVLCL